MQTAQQTNPTFDRFVIDPMHSHVGFSVRHLMITNVRGVFTSVTGTARYNPSDMSATEITAEIASASVDTREPQRDAHLRSAEFFDAENHPRITFRSTRARTIASGTMEVTGDLSMRGTTREVTLTVTEISQEQRDHRGIARIGASATARIKRSEFGMLYNRVLEAGHLAVGDEITLTFDVSLMKQ